MIDPRDVPREIYFYGSVALSVSQHGHLLTERRHGLDPHVYSLDGRRQLPSSRFFHAHIPTRYDKRRIETLARRDKYNFSYVNGKS
jgi:hypothetical protein